MLTGHSERWSGIIPFNPVALMYKPMPIVSTYNTGLFMNSASDNTS